MVVQEVPIKVVTGKLGRISRQGETEDRGFEKKERGRGKRKVKKSKDIMVAVKKFGISRKNWVKGGQTFRI